MIYQRKRKKKKRKERKKIVSLGIMKKIIAILTMMLSAAIICAAANLKKLPEGTSEIELTFSCRCTPGTEVIFQALNAGVIADCSVNGKDIILNEDIYPYTGHAEERLTIRNLSPKHKVRLRIKGVTPETAFSWLAAATGEKISARAKMKIIKTVPRAKTLRVMDWNIQNGMWAGQEDNYDRFVEYMKGVDADVCILCESQTIYYTGTREFSKHTEQYLPYKYRDYPKKTDPGFEPEGWLELAARYGHKYVRVGAHKDDYPVIITSKYPITLIQKIGGEGISHGGIHAQITVHGETVNYVGFHTYPHPFGKGVKGDEARAASKARHEGDYYRENEMKIIMNRTILNPEYSSEKNWLIMGDTNCPSPLDARHLGYAPDATNYLGHRFMLDNVPATDLMKSFSCPDDRDVFIRTMHRKMRIDMMYGSKSMTDRMINAKTPEDEFTRGSFNEEVRFYNISSDHLPLVVDFAF